jgi:hypothetical protein
MTDPMKVAPTYVSATQISTYRLCPRKWGYRKLDGIKAPPNKYAAAGTAIHELIEAWLLHGTPIPVDTPHGKMVMPGLKHLPAPKTAEVEREVRLQMDDGIIYILKIDVHQPYDGSVIRIWDHKTTSDFKWAKTPEKLAKDEQVVIYATAAIMLYAESTENQTYEEAPPAPLELNWVYYRRNEKKPGSKKVQLRVLPSEQKDLSTDDLREGTLTYGYIEQQFEAIHETALQLKQHHELGHKAKDLPYRVEGCNAFGGCPYRGNPCKLTPTEIFRGALNQVSIVESLKAAKAAKGGASASAATTTQPSAEASNVAEQIKAQANETAAAAAAASTAAAAPPEPAQVNPPEEPKGAVSVTTQRQESSTRLQAAVVIAASMANSGLPDKDVAKRALGILKALEDKL